MKEGLDEKYDLQYLDNMGYGICEKCENIEEIGRGDRFHYIEALGEWQCTECADKLVGDDDGSC